MTHFNVYWTPEPRALAEWHNHLQRLAEQTRLAIPVTISSDPRHGFSANPATSCSRWALLAVARADRAGRDGDAALVEEFGDIARQEYLAVGIRVALHPMADLATEPRWARADGTFGEDAELSSRHARRLHPRLPGRGARAGQRRVYDQALPGRRPAEGWRGPALPLRPRAGLPRRQLRLPPDPVRGGVRGRHGADHAVLRHADRDRRSRRSASGSTRM